MTGTEAKKRKVEDENERSGNDVEENSFCFRNFKLNSVLREDARLKLITLHGFINDQDAVIILERKPFDASSIEKSLQQTKTHEETLQNDIYSTFDLCSDSVTPDMKMTLIHPATQKHIEKYTQREPFIIHETPEMYRDVTLPWIEKTKFSIQWVYNILDKKTEAERIIVEDKDPEIGFVMVPDMKWDRKTMETLYVVAIVHKRGIRCMRDLTQDHLPLLENILHKSQKNIEEKFGVSPSKLRMYFHYQPSYYHLHVHITHVKFDAPGTDTLRAHILQDVMDNLRMDSDFYKKKTLTYVVQGNDMLFNMYKEKGFIK